ncbi:MAG: glutamyl-tRNA synthetase [bacterium]|jgi:glutamyl-tRNA synthetase
MNKTVRTRFAPSPTGMLHIGGARTALFNYLFAKANNGEYLIRIEDTDQARSTDENKEIIKNGLSWLGLGPTDGKWVLQTTSIERHKEAVQKLLAEGKAYECFTSKEELTEMREEQQAKKETIRYDGRHRNLTEEQKQTFRDQGRQAVIRIKVPTEGKTGWDDAVQGRIDVPNYTLDDYIIMRTDGFPTYNFVVALDDHDMEITHVIRGDDHINNTPKQIFVYEAMGYELPTFAHVPMIHGKNGKMSKRDGATNVLEYKTAGFLPEALNNYLMRLGWSLGDEEVISMERAIENFDINDVNKSASVFDQMKLEWFNAQYIKNSKAENLFTALEPVFNEKNLTVTDEVKGFLLNGGIDSVKNKPKKLGDLADACTFFFNKPPFTLDEKEQSILDTDGYKDNLKLFVSKIETEKAAIDHDKVSEIIGALCEEHALKFKDFGMPLRVALTGTCKAPGVGDIIEIFGKDVSIENIKACL